MTSFFWYIGCMAVFVYVASLIVRSKFSLKARRLLVGLTVAIVVSGIWTWAVYVDKIAG